MIFFFRGGGRKRGRPCMCGRWCLCVQELRARARVCVCLCVRICVRSVSVCQCACVCVRDGLSLCVSVCFIYQRVSVYPLQKKTVTNQRNHKTGQKALCKKVRYLFNFQIFLCLNIISSFLLNILLHSLKHAFTRI